MNNAHLVVAVLVVLAAAAEASACATHEASTDLGADDASTSTLPGDAAPPPSLADASDATADAAADPDLLADRVDPSRLAVDATHVYWLELGNFAARGSTGAAKRSSFIRRINKATGAIDVVVADTKASIKGFAIDAVNVYFTSTISSGGGLIQAQPKSGGAAVPLHRVEIVNFNAQTATGMAVEGGYLYFDILVRPNALGPEKLWRIPLPTPDGGWDGGLLAREPIRGTATSDFAPLRYAVRGPFVYRISPDATIRRALVDGGSEGVLGATLEPDGLTLDETYAFWGAGAFGAVVRAPQDPGTTADAGVETVVADYAWRPSNVRVDATQVFWFDGTAIRRAPKTGGPSVILATTSYVSDLVVDDAHVYWTNPLDGTVRRARK